jgi:transmembrane sensor
MKTNIIQELLERYHQGKVTPEERLDIEKWLQITDENDLAVPPAADMQAIEDKSWTELSGRIFPKNEPKKFNWMWFTKIAASVILVIGLALYIYHSFYGRQQQGEVISYHEVSVPKGKKAVCTLPDGTVVQLNADSKLKYPEKFTDTSRVIEFEGEAFFTVAKDKKRPFSINSKQTVVRVLGTHFNLRAYPHENTANVVVEEGRVKFSIKNKKDFLILTANQQGTYTADHSLKQQNVYAAAYYSWRNNQLQFNDEKLADIAQSLERWYNIRVIIKNAALKNERYTGKFNNPAVSSVLSSMAFAIKFNYHITGTTLTIF